MSGLMVRLRDWELGDWRKCRSLVMLVLLLGLAACSQASSGEPEPPTIHYGEDICEFCSMIVSEERFAAGYITTDGQEYVFDDIGDMVKDRLRNQMEVSAIFVHDYDEHTWIRAETAHYARSAELATPMLSGVAAFSSANRAERFAAEMTGQTFTFDALVAHYQNEMAASSHMPSLGEGHSHGE